MNQQPWLIFLKYPYSTAAVGSVWIGGAIMVLIDPKMPVVSILLIDILSGWIITWSSFRSRSAK
jgi:hypothetical protein